MRIKVKSKGPDKDLQYSLDYNAPLDYLPRIKSYYLGLGYESVINGLGKMMCHF